MKKRILSALFCLAILLNLASCGETDGLSDDVVVLFTNDVHCGIDDNIGYAGIAAYKKDMAEKYRYVVLADCGDFSQGSYEGAVSGGENIIDLMNAVGYDFAVFGNHEFDYGLEQLKNNVRKSTAQFLNCNLTYNGTGEDWLSTDTKPYEIRTYGKMKVAFIGVSTPWSISTSTPLHFMEGGKTVYDFCGSDGADHFYENMQKNVDECRGAGADYVVVLSHLGMDEATDTPFTSPELAENTVGIDVILDAHSHVEAACWVYQNKDGGDVLISSTGTKLANIGKLVLSGNGGISVGYVDRYEKKDESVSEKIEQMRKAFAEQKNAVVAHSDITLSCNDGEGIRMVRSRETAIGDFAADAYRILGNADIGMCNGGGIRADIESGDITYGDIIAVNPYGNMLCVVKVTGAELLDMMEYFYRYVQSEYKKDGRTCGEDGSFQQVSGLSFTIDTSIESNVLINDTEAIDPSKTNVLVDESDNFIRVEGARRVSDVKVLKNGEYVPLDPNATYTLASHNYMIKNGGSGMLNFLAGHELVIDESSADYQVLIDYINLLGGDLSRYKTADNRITVR